MDRLAEMKIFVGRECLEDKINVKIRERKSSLCAAQIKHLRAQVPLTRTAEAHFRTKKDII